MFGIVIGSRRGAAAQWKRGKGKSSSLDLCVPASTSPPAQIITEERMDASQLPRLQTQKRFVTKGTMRLVKICDELDFLRRQNCGAVDGYGL